MKNTFKKIITNTLTLIIILLNFYLGSVFIVDAAINKEINYQGRLLDSAGDAVADGTYDIDFALYTVATLGTPVWTESQSVQTRDGLFSVMLGDVSTLEGVNFNQTLYLGLDVEADGEMTPRKILGAVTAAFEADKLDGISSEQFFRNDIANSTNTATTSMVVEQLGSGDVARFIGASGVNALTVTSNGRVAVGTTTPDYLFQVHSGSGQADFAITTNTNVGSANATTFQFISDADGTPNVAMLGQFNDGSLRFSGEGNLVSPDMIITDAGNVGIGSVSTTHKFNLGGSAKIIASNNDIAGAMTLWANNESQYANIGWGGIGSSYSLTLQSGGGQDINLISGNNTIISTGNVGIGSTSPSSKLVVAGETTSQYFTATSTTATSTLPNLNTTNAAISGRLYDGSSSSGTTGYVLQTTGSGISWVATTSLGFVDTGITSYGIGDAVTSGTAGSVLFVDSSGNLAQDNDGFNYDSVNNYLSLGTSTDALVVGNITGNTRGYYAVDLQSYRSGSDKVASGQFSVSVGTSNLASGLSSTAVGVFSSAQADLASVFGFNSIAASENSTAVGWFTHANAIGASVFGGGATGAFNHMVNDVAYSTMIGPSATSSVHIFGSTGEVKLPYVTATSTTATSTLPNLNTTNAAISGRLYDGSSSSGTTGYVLQTTGSGISWVATTSLGFVDTGITSYGIGDAVTSGTAGSVLFVDSSGNLAQDNAGFFWDATNDRLGIGTTSPSTAFSVGNTNGVNITNDGRIFAYTPSNIYTPTFKIEDDRGDIFSYTGAQNYVELNVKTSSSDGNASWVGNFSKGDGAGSLALNFNAGASTIGSIGIDTTNDFYLVGASGRDFNFGVGNSSNFNITTGASSNISAIAGNTSGTGNLSLLGTTAGGNTAGIVTSGGDTLSFTTASTTRMTVTSTGNVGIGSTSPSSKLVVAGETTSQYFTATSTTATSTLPNLNTTNAAISGRLYDGSSSSGTTGYILQTTGSGISWVSTSTLGLATNPGGSNTQVQFNDSGSFGGDSGFTYNKTTDTLTVNGGVEGVSGDYSYSLSSLIGLSLVDSSVSDTAALTASYVGFDSSTYLSSNYLNFSGTIGSSGYGVRNNAGTIEYKNSAGDWTSFDSLEPTQPIFAIGSVSAYSGSSLPSGWLWADGSVISRTTYADLFALIGTTYGAGDGSTTFALPDLRGRTIAGKDNMNNTEGTGGGDAVRLTSTSKAAIDGDTLGASGGVEEHTLTTAEVPARSAIESLNTNNNAPTTGGSLKVVSGNSVSRGGGEAHTNVQPTLVLNYIIRYTNAEANAAFWSKSGSDLYYATGSVGIGTTTPQRALHVAISTDGAPVRFQDSNGYCEINPTSTTWTCTSDERLKENIISVASSTPDLAERMMKLRPVTFEWKTDETNSERVGFIAQEVEVLFPEFVTTDSETGLKSVSYGSFIPYVISVLQDLAGQIKALTQRIDDLTSNSLASVAGVITKLTIGSEEKPTGITLFDEATGDPYCLSVKNGDVVTKIGACVVDEQDNSSDDVVIDNQDLNEDVVEESEVVEENQNSNANPDFTSNIEETNDQDIVFEEEEEPVVIENDLPEQVIQEDDETMEVETNQSSGSIELPIE